MQMLTETGGVCISRSIGITGCALLMGSASLAVNYYASNSIRLISVGVMCEPSGCFVEQGASNEARTPRPRDGTEGVPCHVRRPAQRWRLEREGVEERCRKLTRAHP